MQDKIPNIDRSLEITDEKLYPIGKIEVQLKTLDADYYSSPKYSCKPEFIAYCYQAQVPVLLIVVDQQNKRAYWRHMNLDAIHEYKSNIRFKTYALPIPKENCLDGEHHDYVGLWTTIIHEMLNKVRGFDTLRKQRDELLNKIDRLLRNPTELPVQNLRELYNFLDIYNHILDREFPSIKKILYPDYWKIGIGVITYKLVELHFLLFPVEYTSSQTLVKSISKKEYKVLESDMFGNNVLLIATRESASIIQDTPTRYAYSLLSGNIKNHVSKVDLFIPNQFVANEYLVNFIDKFCAYLGLPEGANEYDIADLDFRLNRLIPMLVGTKKGFAEWVTEFDQDIDSDSRFSRSSNHDKAILQAFKDLEIGTVPKVKIKLYSKTFNLETVAMCVKWLVQNGHSNAQRVYMKGQVNSVIRNVEVWKRWNIDVLWSNFQVFFQNFFDVYDLYLDTHFPLVAKSLGFFEQKNFSIACVLRLGDNDRIKPHLEMHFLIPAAKSESRRVFCFRSDDPSMPLNRSALRVDNHCTIEGINYEVVETWGRPVDFMFEYSPVYEFLKSNLADRLDRFFSRMSSIEY